MPRINKHYLNGHRVQESNVSSVKATCSLNKRHLAGTSVILGLLVISLGVVSTILWQRCSQLTNDIENNKRQVVEQNQLLSKKLDEIKMDQMDYYHSRMKSEDDRHKRAKKGRHRPKRYVALWHMYIKKPRTTRPKGYAGLPDLSFNPSSRRFYRNGKMVREHRDGNIKWNLQQLVDKKRSFTKGVDYNATDGSIKIKYSGFYHVFAAITYNGCNLEGGAPSCKRSHPKQGHKLILISTNESERVLLQSFVTQTAQGFHYMNNRSEYAHDTLYIGGNFHLEDGDRLAVRFNTPAAAGKRVYVGFNETFNNFGGYKIY